jgi:nucleoside-diphosphate kinase
MEKMTLEKTLVFVKPGNYEHQEIIFDVLEKQCMKKGFKKSKLFLIKKIPEEAIRKHYQNIKGKSFYEPTINAFLDIDYPLLFRTYSGDNIIERVRNAIGDTDPKKAKEGTIRFIFGNDSFEQAYRERRYLNNVIHASSNKKEAKREIEIWKDYLK